MIGETDAVSGPGLCLLGIASCQLGRAIFEDSGLWAIIVSADGVIEASSPAAAAMFHRSVAEIVGARLEEILEPETARERRAFIARVLESGQLLTVDSVLGGHMRRSFLRPLPSVEGAGERAGRVLIIGRSRPLDGSRAMVEARHNEYGRLAALTGRELTVLTLIAKGQTTSQIAKAMHRSVKTVEWHRVSLGTKLGAKNRVELARFAIEAGLAEAGLDGA